MAAPDAGPAVTARDGGHPNQSRGQVEVRLLVIQGHSPSRSGCLHPSPSPAACKRRALGVRPRSADRRRGYSGGTLIGRGNRDRPQNRLDSSKNGTRQRSGTGCNHKAGPNSLGARGMLGSEAGNKEGPAKGAQGTPRGSGGSSLPTRALPWHGDGKKTRGRSHVSSSHGAGGTKRQRRVGGSGWHCPCTAGTAPSPAARRWRGGNPIPAGGSA